MLRYSVILVCFGLALVLVAAEEETCKSGGKTYKKGETFPLENGCGIWECVGAGQMSGKICPDFFIRPESGCRRQKGKGKKYPDCCDRSICPGQPGY